MYFYKLLLTFTNLQSKFIFCTLIIIFQGCIETHFRDMGFLLKHNHYQLLSILQNYLERNVPSQVCWVVLTVISPTSMLLHLLPQYTFEYYVYCAVTMSIPFIFIVAMALQSFSEVNCITTNHRGVKHYHFRLLMAKSTVLRPITSKLRIANTRTLTRPPFRRYSRTYVSTATSDY